MNEILRTEKSRLPIMSEEAVKRQRERKKERRREREREREEREREEKI